MHKGKGMRSSPLRHPTRQATRSSPQQKRAMTTARRVQASKPVTVKKRTFAANSNPAESVFSGANAAYIDGLYQSWKSDPTSVHSSWANHFKTGAFVAPAGIIPGDQPIAARNIGASSSGPVSGGVDSTTPKVLKLVEAFRKHGHLAAKIDPLEIDMARGAEDLRKRLTPEAHGLTAADLSKNIDLTPYGENLRGTVGDIVAKVTDIYANTVGVEFEHVESQAERDFLYSAFEELKTKAPLQKDHKLRILNQLAKATQFEAFLKQKYNVKRFGLEGGESNIVALQELIEQSTDNGAETFVMGMAHRGRLNVLTNIVGKPTEIQLSEFAGNYDAREAQRYDEEEGAFVTKYGEYASAGDVKYHQGWSAVHNLPNGKECTITMIPNPSHLETVDTLVAGKTRAKQDALGVEKATAEKKVVGITLHGDAAFAGQGVVSETLAMHRIPGYSTGGTIHIVTNNQVGFTTDPSDSRSGVYCSDIAKAYGAPIFHVNGDDVESVSRVSRLAADYRAKFGGDVVIDLVCYRVNGHNELDQPFFTQPTQYAQIAKQVDVYTKYRNKLLQGGDATSEEIESIDTAVLDNLKTKFEEAKEFTDKPHDSQALQQKWSNIAGPNDRIVSEATAVNKDHLKTWATEIANIPDQYVMHRGVSNVMKDRQKRAAEGTALDWSQGEHLAFASLLNEGIPVRIAGQDVQRGTFSHRHAVVHDQNTNKQYTPLHNISNPIGNNKKLARFDAINSFLSEYAALGFELGYSYENPNSLTIWEAQFGDFVNGSQIILDNYLSSGEYKWGKQTNLVMLLPHGYEGQGAEHSSARMERFLQSANDDARNYPKNADDEEARIHRHNWQILNLTTSANYFHSLRRQVKRNIRKPMIVFSPKSLLRHPGAASSYDDMSGDSKFQETIPDTTVNPANVKTHVLCSGKVYYEIVEQLEKSGQRDHVAVTRIEQLSPFPFAQVDAQQQRFGKAKPVWVQEEHKNMGAYSYVAPRIEKAFEEQLGASFKLPYIGRPPAAAAATGSSIVHKQEAEQMWGQLLKF